MQDSEYYYACDGYNKTEFRSGCENAYLAYYLCRSRVWFTRVNSIDALCICSREEVLAAAKYEEGCRAVIRHALFYESMNRSVNWYEWCVWWKAPAELAWNFDTLYDFVRVYSIGCQKEILTNYNFLFWLIFSVIFWCWVSMGLILFGIDMCRNKYLISIKKITKHKFYWQIIKQ